MRNKMKQERNTESVGEVQEGIDGEVFHGGLQHLQRLFFEWFVRARPGELVLHAVLVEFQRREPGDVEALCEVLVGGGVHSAELDTCESNWLKPELGLVDPKVIVTLGRFSLARLLPDERIGRARGKTLRWGDYTVFPIYHPAAALHQPQLRNVIMEDFQKLPGVLRSIGAPDSSSDIPDQAAEPPSESDEPEPQQLNLF